MTEANATEAPTVLQALKLQELSDVLGQKNALVFVGRFHNELSVRLQDVEANRGVPAMLAEIAHKLVGIAGALGLDELASASHRLSRKAREASTEKDLSDQCTVVITAGHRAIMAIADYVK